MLLLSAFGGPYARVTMKLESPGGTTGVEENPLWERYRESWREREARRRAEAEARRAAAQEAVERAIRTVAPRYPGIRRVYLFGSVLRPGVFRPDSDIDVGVEGDDGHGLFDFWRELEAAAPGWAFDVRPLDPEDPFSQRVQERGRLIYERTPSGASIGSAGGVDPYPPDLQRPSGDP